MHEGVGAGQNPGHEDPKNLEHRQNLGVLENSSQKVRTKIGPTAIGCSDLLEELSSASLAEFRGEGVEMRPVFPLVFQLSF